jgi:hypothetical protein
MEKNKRTDNDLQNITQKTKGRTKRTPLQTENELRSYGKVSSSCFTCGTRHGTAKLAHLKYKSLKHRYFRIILCFNYNMHLRISMTDYTVDDCYTQNSELHYLLKKFSLKIIRSRKSLIRSRKS